MSSQVVGVSPFPFINSKSYSCPERLMRSVSVNSNGTQFLHMPYPWIPDSDFVRPSNGYQISGTPSSNYASALVAFQNYNWYVNLTSDGMPVARLKSDLASAASTSVNVNGCYGYPGQSLTGYFQFRPRMSNAAYKSSSQKCGGIGTITVTDGNSGFDSSWTSNPRAGTLITLPITDTSLSKIHATFFYGIHYIPGTGTSTAFPLVSDRYCICRYQPTSSSFVSVSATLSTIYTAYYTNDSNKPCVYALYRIHWNARQGITPSGGSPSVELPSLYMPLTDLSGNYEARMTDIQGVIVLGKS